MIEIRKRGGSDREDDYQLFVDGALLDEVIVETHGRQSNSELSWFITFQDYKTFRELRQNTFSDLPNTIEHLRVKNQLSRFEQEDIIYIGVPYVDESVEHYFYADYSFKADLWQWKKSYSFAEYMDEFERLYKQSPIANTSLKNSKDYDYYAFWLKFDVLSPDTIIVDTIDKYTEMVDSLCEAVENSLISRISNKSIAISFDFPEEVKVPCEQYLLYFVQFLRDLGIEAASELKDEAGQVLFTVDLLQK